MSKEGLFDRMKVLVSGLTGRNSFGKEDFVLLKTALMLAAVDGDVSAEEVSQFKELAEQCHGYCGKSFEVLWEQTLRSAGYLLLQSRFLDQEGLVAVFVKEAEKDFVGEVSQEDKSERVRAFEFLERMAMADGVYSDIERACVAALTKSVKEAWGKLISQRYSRAVIFPEDRQ